jgi:hypothetical protein
VTNAATGSVSLSQLLGISSAQAADNKPNGLIEWERDPNSPFAATPAFTKRFAGSPEEVAVLATILTIVAGGKPIREMLHGNEVQLPGGRKAIYNIYAVGPPGSPGPGRIAHIEGTNVFYYSPYHYLPGPDVPNAWIKITYRPPVGVKKD